MADLNGDGKLDILSKPYNWDTPRVDVWLNRGPAQAAKAVGISASFRGPVGLQLYSLRDILSKNVAAGLKTARCFRVRRSRVGRHLRHPARGVPPTAGISRVQGCVGDHGLRAFEKDPEEAARQAEASGVSYAGVGWIPHRGQFDEAAARKAAAVFNRAGTVLAKHGIQFFYHTHGYEFVPHGRRDVV